MPFHCLAHKMASELKGPELIEFEIGHTTPTKPDGLEGACQSTPPRSPG